MITCNFPDGNEAKLRHCSVDTIVFNTAKTKILLVLRSKTLISAPGKWALPGGYLDRDENIQQGASREVLEETGYSLIQIEISHFSDDPARTSDGIQNVGFFCKATADKKIQEPDDESEKVMWFDLNDLPAESDFAFDHYETIKIYAK